MKYLGRTGEYFEVTRINDANHKILSEATDSQLTLLWFLEDGNEMIIDSIHYTFNKNQIICISSLHQFEVISLKDTKLLRFNEPFYCILNHDKEVGCKGILFFGNAHLPIIDLNGKDLELLDTVWKMLLLEMDSRDNLQLDMLQMMLKRILILCTRVYKTQEEYQQVEHQQIDILREFNYLVEQHFREKHSVAEYAQLLNKSPKTISNLFNKLNSKSPLSIIQDRIILEVRRLLKYTDRSVSEIGFDLGFQDVQSFSRFFKKKIGQSPTEFREFL